MEFDERKLKRAMALASKSRARFALIIGEDEVASGRYGLKDLSAGVQQALSIEEVIEKVR